MRAIAAAQPASTRTPGEAEDELRRVFRQMPGALWRTDRHLRLSHVVGRSVQAFGLEHEIVGKTIAEFLGTSDNSDPALAIHYAALAGEQSSLRYEFNGRWYDLHVEPLRATSQEIVGTIGVAIDVTARHETESRLAQSDARLAEAQRLAHVGSWEWDVDEDRVTWSEELNRIYGFAEAEFEGTFEGYLRAVHPDDRALTKSVISDACRRAMPFTYEHRIVRPNGEVRMLHTRGDVVPDKSGKAARMVGSCWDVTEQWRAKAELERSLSIICATLEATAEGILVVDRKGKFTAYNSRFVAMWRIPERIIATKDDEQALSFVLDQLEALEDFLERVRELYAYPQAESFDVVRFKDGRIFERRSLPQRLGEDVIGRVWSFRDVTDREHQLGRAVVLADASRLLASLDLEQALHSVARMFLGDLAESFCIDVLGGDKGPTRLIAERIDGARRPPGISMTVLGGAIQQVSRGKYSSIAVPITARRGVIGAMTLCAPRGRRYSPGDVALAQELASRIASYSPGDVALAQELASRIALAMENAELYTAAKKALRARDEFLSVAAHEIRGPVTSLHLAVQSLQRNTLSRSARAKALAIIERDDRRIARFVDELLDLARVRSGAMAFHFEQVDLGGVLRDVASQLAPELARSGSELTLRTQGELAGSWDRMRVGQIFTNLLSNAIKFGGGKPIEASVSATSWGVVLTVKDSGLGISEDVQTSIFEPFERAAAARPYGGLGLGLYIVRTIVEALGGSIRVESAPQAGATFVVELPQRNP